MKVFTFDEFMQADFPVPDLQEDKFSGLDTADMCCWRTCESVPRLFMQLVTETTARLYQIAIMEENLAFGCDTRFAVVPKGSVTGEKLRWVLAGLCPDAGILDFAAFTDNVKRLFRKHAAQHPEVSVNLAQTKR